MSVLSAKIHKQNPLYLSSPTTAGVMSNTVVPVSLLGITSYFCRHPVSVIVKTSRQKNCLICFACLHFFFFLEKSSYLSHNGIMHSQFVIGVVSH